MLTTVFLTDNQIGDKGAKHLAAALHDNKVTFILSLLFSYKYSLHTGTHRAAPF
jgi:hypothetical protein